MNDPDVQHTLITLFLALIGMFVMILCVWSFRLWQEARYLKTLLTEDTSIALRAGKWWQEFERTSKRAIAAPLLSGIITMMVFSEIDNMAAGQSSDYQYDLAMAVFGVLCSSLILISAIFILLTRMSLHRFPAMVSMSADQLGHQLSERIMDLAVSLHKINSQRMFMQDKQEELHELAADPFHDATRLAMMQSTLADYYQSDQATCSIIEQQCIKLHDELVQWPSSDPASGARLLSATEALCRVSNELARTEPPHLPQEECGVDQLAPLLADLQSDCQRFFKRPIL